MSGTLVERIALENESNFPAHLTRLSQNGGLPVVLEVDGKPVGAVVPLRDLEIFIEVRDAALRQLAEETLAQSDDEVVDWDDLLDEDESK
ncbi:MAG: hypothetical protein AAB353_09070 [Candidatus Hydrogenedentota bacterium]